MIAVVSAVVKRPAAMSLSAVVAFSLLLSVGTAVSRASEPLPMLLSDRALVDDLHEARALMLNLRLEDAERRLAELGRQGGTAAATHHLAVISLLKALLTDDEDSLSEFFRQSDALSRALKVEEGSPWSTYLQAENDFNRAVAYAKQGKNMRAALAGRSAHGRYQRLLRDDPSFEEAYKGLGVIKLAIGTLPSGYRSVMRLIGFSGSVEDGLAYLRRASTQSTFNKEESIIYLALLTAQVERSSEEPVELLHGLHRQYPDSPLVGYLYGFMLLQYRYAAEAEQVLRPLAARDGWRIKLADYFLGHALFVQGEYEEAFSWYRRYYERHEGETLRALAAVGAGLALEVTGKRAEAIEWYRRVDDSRGYDGDMAAGREARARLEEPLTGLTRDLLLARNAFDSGRYQRAVGLLTVVLNDAKATPAQRAEAAYRIGRTYHAMERYDEALAWYAQGALNAEHLGGRWAPWGHFFRGEIYFSQGKKDQARKEHSAAAGYSHSYDYQDALQQSVRGAMDRLD